MWLGSGVAVAVVWGAAVVLIGPLAWEFPCVMGETLKSQKKKKKSATTKTTPTIFSKKLLSHSAAKQC